MWDILHLTRCQICFFFFLHRFGDICNPLNWIFFPWKLISIIFFYHFFSNSCDDRKLHRIELNSLNTSTCIHRTGLILSHKFWLFKYIPFRRSRRYRVFSPQDRKRTENKSRPYSDDILNLKKSSSPIPYTF